MKKCISLLLNITILINLIWLNCIPVYSMETSDTTVIDCTDLFTGDVISHDCSKYLSPNKNASQHWQECVVCGKKFNVQNHNFTQNWTMGNSCNPSNKLLASCACGYNYVVSNNTRAHDYYFCCLNNQICGYRCRKCYTNTGVAPHQDAAGRPFICANNAKCIRCGWGDVCHSAGIYFNTINNTYTNAYCYNCQKPLTTSGNTVIARNGAYFYITTTVNWTYNFNNARVAVSEFPSTYDPNMIAITSSSYNFNGNTLTMYINGYFKPNIETPAAIGLIHFSAAPTNNTMGMDTSVGVTISPDVSAPTIAEIKQKDLSEAKGWSTSKEITISGTENWCKNVYITVKSDDGEVLVDNERINTSSNNYSYNFIPHIEVGEEGKTYNVSVKDSLGNTATSSFTVKNVDSKAPCIILDKETSKEWSKTKDILVDTTDFGARDVSISFNDTEDYRPAERNENNFTRPYTLTGDVYGQTTAAIYAEDCLGNTRTEFITIHNLDNTAPTITSAVSERQGIRNAIVTVAANDINTKLNASGSGVVGYAITQETELPSEDVFQSENTFNLTKSGTWYVWSIDAVGNISEPVSVDVKIEYTVSLDANGGTLTGDSEYQIISGETITIPEPVREGYTFTGWTVDGTGSSVNGNGFTMGSEDAEIIANWQINQYEVTYIDVVDSTLGEQLGTTSKMIDYHSQVRGNDIGSDTTDNAYYNGYYYVSDTSDIVTINGATVYRIFTLRTVNVNGTISWNDHENKYHTRPDVSIIRLYRDGVGVDSIVVSTIDTVNKYAFNDLQKYSFEDGHEYEYTVSQDTVYSQASLENSEDKYTIIQNGYDFYNGIRNTERPVEPGYPDEPENPDDKGLYAEGDIYWDDNEDSLGFRPSETTITLYQKGEDGEWKVFGDPIVVDTKTENHYIFDWLPKYWYDENDVPTAYEYKTEETFTSWYVEDGEIKNIYTIVPDTPKDCDFTNIFNFPDGPIIPVNEYKNTIIVKTNTDEQVRITLKPLELFIHDDYSVSYGEPTGNDILVMTDKTGTSVGDLIGTRYEVVLDSPDYTLGDMKLTLAENMELEKIDGKWYVTIKNVPGDIIGTLEVELSPKEQFFQDRQRFMNYFAVQLKEIAKELQEHSIMKMSDAVVTPVPETEKVIPDIVKPSDYSELTDGLTITYMDSDTNDLNIYSAGDEVEILDYLGMIPAECKFIGWSETQNSSEAEYVVGNTVEVKENIILYPIFETSGKTENILEST